MKTSEELLKTTMNHPVNSQMHDYLFRLHFGSCPVRTPGNQEIPKRVHLQNCGILQESRHLLTPQYCNFQAFQIHKLYQIDFHMNQVVAVEN
jgi:hypothetical protein